MHDGAFEALRRDLALPYHRAVGLLQGGDGRGRISLASRCLVGRAPYCTIRLTDARVSSEHARLVWTDDQWWVRDLASRNGTFVRGERIESGRNVSLGAGDELGFGSAADHVSWTLIDPGPPVAQAREVVSGLVIEGRPNMLALPHPESPELTVYSGGTGWLLDDEPPRRVADGERIVVRGQVFELSLPEPVLETADTTGGTRVVECELSFRLSRDEEYVVIEVRRRNGSVRLDHRAHNYVLAVLARLRLEDRERRALPSSEEGWVHIEDLARMLRTDPERINVDVFRARQQFAELGFRDAMALVERRRSVRQLRIGVAAVRVSLL